MAFSTEFVMGAGGAEVEEIPVSASGVGNPVTYPLTTVNAGNGAWIWVDGTLSIGTSVMANAPQLHIGDRYYGVFGPRAGCGGYFTGSVPIRMISRSNYTSTFSGTVYVTRV